MDLTNLNKDRKNRRRLSPQGSDVIAVYGKVPPQAIDLEEAVIGACLLDASAYPVVAEQLKPQSFYRNSNQLIFEAMGILYNAHNPIDILTVVEQLKRMERLDEVGGPYYVTKVTNAVVSTANVEAHSRIILQMYLHRCIIQIAGTMMNESFEGISDPLMLMDMASETFFALQEEIYKGDTKTLQELTRMEIAEMDTPLQREGITGIPTGYRKIDKITAGWQPADLIILAARPSMGKSALAGQFAYRSARLYGVPTAIFSLEMPARKFVHRIISAETRIRMDSFARRNYSLREKEGLVEFSVAGGSSPLYFDDNANQTLPSICMTARKLVRTYMVGLIVIDYLQLINNLGERSGTRDQDIGIITRGLKQLAKELNIPIIALSQLSRETEKKENRRPMLSHLRESGNIEQDADVVMFLYRGYYYMQRDNPGQIVDQTYKTESEVNFAKHRNGALDTIQLIFREEYAAFYEQGEEDMLPF